MSPLQKNHENSFYHFIHFSKQAISFKYLAEDFELMFMKNEALDRELDKLVEGRMKILSHINLKEELDFRENISVITSQDGDEVFGE